MDTPPPNSSLVKRIDELGQKSNQVLIALSFVILAAIELEKNCATSLALRIALRIWIAAILPAILGIVPLKEVCWEASCWYGRLRGFKVVMLWATCLCILAGAIAFFVAL